MYPRLLRPALALPALALLSACGGTYNGGVESVYQPVVTRSDYVFDLTVGANGLAPGEAQRLAGWMGSMRLGYGDQVSVDDGGMGGIARDQVAAEAGRYGLLLAAQAPITPGELAPGTVRVVVTRMSANVPNCPDYSRVGQPDFAGSTSSNFGCATNSNLAKMVANPADLVRGQPGSGLADPATASKPISTLRAAPPSGAGGLKSESTGGK